MVRRGDGAAGQPAWGETKMKTRTWFLLGLALAVALSLAWIQGRSSADDAAGGTAGEAVKAAGPSDGLFLHVSHGADDPHRPLMAFRMAAAVAASGRPVLVYCDIEAVRLLVKGAPEVALAPFPDASASLRAMLGKGVRVRACPTCLKVAGFTEADLIDGVRLADRDEFFSFADGRILSIDY